MTLQLRPQTALQAGWLALSDLGILDSSPANGMMHKGQFVIEISLPLEKPTVLLDYQCNDLWPRTFALLFDPQAGFSIIHRQGGRVQRHVLPGPLPQAQGQGRLTFAFDAPARHWSLRFECPSDTGTTAVSSTGSNPLPLQVADLAALCTQTHAAQVLWFGASDTFTLPGSAPWLGLRTQIETSRGPIAAGNLKPGDIILTQDCGPRVLLSAKRMQLPARGSFAPVLLRAPYFGQTQDLLVSADQHIATAGLEVEYLFDIDSALIPASALVDGRTALSDNRRPITGSVILDIGGPALISADGCILALGHDPSQELPLRTLKSYEALTLMSLFGRSQYRGVA